MTNTSIKLQDLRRRIYVQAKSEPDWRFWGLFVHVCKMETLAEAYKLARKNAISGWSKRLKEESKKSSPHYRWS
jgi:hypothetical protein